MAISFIRRCDLVYTDESIYHEVINGADVNASFEAGITYLMLAQSEKLVRELLARGADPNAVDIDGKTALFCRGNKKEPGAIRAILEAGCNVNAVDMYNETALTNACDDEVVKILIEFGADVNHADDDGMTPLHSIITLKETQMLVEAGANVNAATIGDYTEDDLGEYPYGTTPLMLAYDYESAKYLIAHGADVDAKTRGGYSVLMYLLKRYELEPVIAVMEAGAKLNVTAVNGNTPLHLICSGICKSLLPEPAHYKKYIVSVVKKLLAAGCDPNARNCDRETPLHTAGSGYALDAMIQARDKYGNTPLHCAAMHNIRCVQALLKAGANPNVLNRKGQNPLFFINEDNCVKPLIRAGIDVNCVDKKGNTPLHDAADRGYVQLLIVLLKKGANPNIRNNHGKTPLHIAAKENDSDSIRQLLKHGADPNIEDNKGHKALSEDDMKKYAGRKRQNKKLD